MYERCTPRAGERREQVVLWSQPNASNRRRSPQTSNGTPMSLTLLQRCVRCCTPISSTISRSFINHAAQRPPPNPTERIPDAKSFLSAIGRSSSSKVKVGEWEDLWKLNGQNLKEQGVAVRDRRYILWAMEKFRQGENPVQFAHELKPKKKIRGRGPAVQFGKRIRSRRKR